MSIAKIKTIVLLCIFLTSCSSDWNKPVETSQELWNVTVNNTTNTSLVTQEKIDTLFEQSLSGDYTENNKEIDQILESITKENEPEKYKKEVAILTLIKVRNILNEGNYTYAEQEAKNQITELIVQIEENGVDYVDPVYKNYLLWYANEITKKYKISEKYYDEALSFAPDIEKNKKIRSILLNQKGHLYDLQWKLQEANDLYQAAYDQDNTNYYASVNLARYFVRTWDYKKAKDFFNHSLKTKDKPLQAEIYFSLSDLKDDESKDLEYNIKKSIEYATLWIKAFPEYPMNYVALARWYYMLNDAQYDKEIETNLWKSLELNKNSSLSYLYYGLYLNSKWNLTDAITLLWQAQQVVPLDMIYMDSDREGEINKISSIYKTIYLLDMIKKEWIEKNKELLNTLINGEEKNYYIEVQKNRLNNGDLNYFIN